MEIGSIIETTEAKKIRYEAKYLGPWVGCGGEVDVPCGVKFRVVEVDGDECRCLCLDESIVEKANRVEIEKTLKRAAGDRLAKKLLGVSFFVLESGQKDESRKMLSVPDRCCVDVLGATIEE